MSTDAIRDAAAEMDEEAFIPKRWLIVAEDASGNTAAIWPDGQDGTMEMLATATASVRHLDGAPGATQ